MADDRRDELLDIVKKEFIGPDPSNNPEQIQPNGEEILIGASPRSRYLAGILYPKDTFEENNQNKEETNLDSFQQDDAAEDFDDFYNDLNQELYNKDDNFEEAEELINRSNAYKPSAISITAAVLTGDSLAVKVSAGQYTTVNVTDSGTGKVVSEYPRRSVSWNNDKKSLRLPDPHNKITTVDINDTDLKFDITYRYKQGDVNVYTFTLENSKSRCGAVRDDDCYFQVSFCLKSVMGFSPLPEVQKKNTSDEDYLTNQLLYRDVKNYAIGHGCAADWDDSTGEVFLIQTSIFPDYDVKSIVPATIDGVSLNMLDYGPDGDIDAMIHELNILCDKYSEWITQKEEEALTLNEKYNNKDYRITADRHIKNCKECLARMREGITLLRDNENVRTAFQYMNLAMIMQQLHYNLPLRKWDCDSENRLYLENADMEMPDPYIKDTWYGDKNRYGKWRPFQIAFVLINLKSMQERDCDERSIIDLIWFPTGGGKTEAYLGLSAYTIFLRRLMNRDDSGTAIIMRYTLRLLTAQQYERASSLICACDIIRQDHEDLFGYSRISIGLWVGSDTTPNQMKEAVKQYDKLNRGTSNENPFVILKCPWCGAQMGIVQRNKTRQIQGYYKSVEAHNKKRIIYKCSNPQCHFSNLANPLPLYVVDEDIYEKTPTLLLGTVDKFAMLPFNSEAAGIFGYKNGKQSTAPDLIIQDELHLISGPLGSMVGHYETMINDLCTRIIDGKRISPKIIASTATISRAKEQCQGLYGCDKDKVFQFPPSGLSYDDSFFAYEDKKRNGRKYVGILAPGASSDATVTIRLFSSLLFAAKEINIRYESERDPYWTNVGYFNSIRELGQARSWVRADIDEYLNTIYKRHRYNSGNGENEIQGERRYIRRDEELTSRISGDRVTENLAAMGISYDGQNYHDKQPLDRPIDICLATNMISVGLDVSRLGLMTVVGQPKTTSEYIQATSRVGRDDEDAPGIIFVLYRPGRPRDKSHYEHFKEYHSRLYCNVEPTSVTPFSAPVRERALHAIMIGMMRLENSDSYNENAPRIPDKELLNHVENVVRERVEKADFEELEETMKRFKERLDDWEVWNPDLWKPKVNKDGSFADDIPLMYYAGDQPSKAWDGRGFETPTSMRSVDASCEARILTRKYTAKED